jgi:hypothetical protein
MDATELPADRATELLLGPGRIPASVFGARLAISNFEGLKDPVSTILAG